MFRCFYVKRCEGPITVQTVVKSNFTANQRCACSVYVAAAAKRRPSPFPCVCFQPCRIKRACFEIGVAYRFSAGQIFRAFRARNDLRRFFFFKISRKLTNNNKALVKPALDEIQGNLLWFVSAVHEMIHHCRWCILINRGASLAACEVTVCTLIIFLFQWYTTAVCHVRQWTFSVRSFIV